MSVQLILQTTTADYGISSFLNILQDTLTDDLAGHAFSPGSVKSEGIGQVFDALSAMSPEVSAFTMQFIFMENMTLLGKAGITWPRPCLEISTSEAILSPLWVTWPTPFFTDTRVIHFFCGGEYNVHSARFTSGATHADLLAAGIAASHFPTCISRGGAWARIWMDNHLDRRRTCYHCASDPAWGYWLFKMYGCGGLDFEVTSYKTSKPLCSACSDRAGF